MMRTGKPEFAMIEGEVLTIKMEGILGVPIPKCLKGIYVMKRQGKARTRSQERQLLHIVRRLQEDRVSQVIDFALFLEVQQEKTHQEQQAYAEHVTDGNTKWETLLENDDAQRLLEKMADEAANEMAAGKAKPMRFTENGQLIHG
jgi:hypothetical protein